MSSSASPITGTAGGGVVKYPQHPYPELKALRIKELALALLSPAALSQSDDRRRVLVVVDMQPGFVGVGEAALMQSVERQIIVARARRWPIVFLEYEGDFGPTHQCLLEQVEGYGQGPDQGLIQGFVRLSKNKWSGAPQVAQACKDWGFVPEYLRVCGVYADQCVSFTVRNLSDDFPAAVVEVLPTACRSYPQIRKGVENYDWFDFPLAANIQLLPEETVDFDAARCLQVVAA